MKNHALLAAVLLAIALLYRETLQSMGAIWLTSQTFAHGLLIGPISMFLLWQQRTALAGAPVQPRMFALLPLFGCSLLWLFAQFAQTQLLSQLAFVAMLPSAAFALMGPAWFGQALFPFAYLFLAVPGGQALIAPLIDFTSWFSVAALQLFGIPVLREQAIISLPSGTWAVAEACSGLRYLIASFALGLLFAYWTFQSWQRRLAFVALSIALPVLANAMRAFIIILIGHASEMRLATGIDHLIYGWVFFCAVLALQFSLGSRWRQPRPSVPATPAAQARSVPWLAALACCGAAALGPLLYAQSLDAPRRPVLAPFLPSMEKLTYAGPIATYAEADAQVFGRRGEVYVQAALLRVQNQDHKLIAPRNGRLASDARVLDERIDNWPLPHRRQVIDTSSGKAVVWRWYRQGGRDIADPLKARLYLAAGRLSGQGSRAVEMLLMARCTEVCADADTPLSQFALSTYPTMTKELDHD